MKSNLGSPDATVSGSGGSSPLSVRGSVAHTPGQRLTEGLIAVWTHDGYAPVIVIVDEDVSDGMVDGAFSLRHVGMVRCRKPGAQVRFLAKKTELVQP